MLTHPLTPTQRALWLLYRLAPDSSAYNIVLPARIRQPIDVPRLRRAFQALVDRHPMLRTTYEILDGEPVYRVHEHTPVSFEEIDISSLGQPQVKPRLTDAVRRPFDLEHGPVMRVELFHRSASEHYLLITIHHIVTDLVAYGILMEDLQALYAAEGAEAPAAQLPAPLRYDEFVRWQSEMLAGPEGEQLWTYWKQKLDGELPLINLPIDRPRPPIQTFEGATHTIRLHDSMVEKVQELAKVEAVTPFIVLLAGFVALLHRYTGQDDIVVGSPVPGRQARPEFKRVMGYFVNMLALRNDLSGEPTFQELLQRVRQTVREARAHQEYPFPLLVERLEQSHDPSRSPLFQVVFTLQKIAGSQSGAVHDAVPAFAMPIETGARIDLGGLILEPAGVPQEEGQQELALHMFEVAGSLYGEFKYKTDLFDAATIERMAAHFQVLMESAVKRPDQPLLALPLLTAAERKRMLEGWNDTRVRWQDDVCTHQLFEAQVARTPDAIAVVCGDERLTYAELNRRANRLAHRLVALGVGRDDVVALLMERGVALVTAILAVFKAGGAYLPLDPDYPPTRLRQVLEQSRVSRTLATGDLAPTLAQALAELPETSRPSAWSLEELLQAEQRVDDLPPRAVPADLAYVIFTSGSTGVPKGAMVEHRGMLNHLYAKVRDLQLTSADIVAQNASQCFDISVWQMLAALVVGGQVHILGKDIANDPRQLFESVATGRITILEVVPSLLRMMLEDVASRGARRPNLTALRWLIPTGEALPPELCRRWLGFYPQVPLMNAYGPTECSDDVAHHPIHAPPGPNVSIMPIGRPVANMRLYVLNARLEPAPIGVAGELYVGGIGVGRGYLHDSKRTQEVFIPDPFSQEPPARLYKTGDLGRFLPDGSIEFLGRVDHQVKIRGFRIELGEIEAVLGKHPAVDTSVVLAREDIPGDKRLVAYVVSATAQDVLAAELKRFLLEKLPEYMVPSAFVVLAAMPLTSNGKVNRAALPAPFWDTPASDATYVAPRSEIEARLATIWAEILGVERVGIHDSFFDLGGHSLSAVQLVTRLRETFQVDFPLRAIFDAPTVAQFAQESLKHGRVLGESDAPAAHVPALVARPAERYEPFPLTDLQQAYWLGQSGLFELSEAPALEYVEVVAVGIDLERLRHAFDQLIERHEMLRTIVRDDGQQQVLEHAPAFQLEIVDLRGKDDREVAAQREATRRRLCEQRTRTDRLPLFQIHAHRLDDDAVRLHAAFPLLLGDARSYAILNRDLERLYRDPYTPLEPLALSFRDYVVDAVEKREAGSFVRSLDYWRSRLPSLPPAPEMPLARAPSAIAQARFTRHSGALPADAWERLKQRATRAGLTPTATLCAAYAEILARWSKTPHFTLNMLYQNRPSADVHPQIQDVIGAFSTTILLEVDLRVAGSFEARAKRLQSQLWSDIEHAQVSGVHVVREMARARGWSTPAAMPIVFASMLHHADVADESATELLGQPVAGCLQTPHVWLDHQVFEKAGELRFNWDVVEDLFPEGVVDAMFEAYCTLLDQLSGDAAWSEDISLRLPAQQSAERAAANATEAPISTALLHGLFAARAAQQPALPAVVDPRRTLTYGELAQKVNQVGRRLRDLGARPNTLVAVVMKKGWEQVVATLGILTAGAAYLPIDPDLPAERIRYLLQNGEVELVLTQPWLNDSLTWPDNVLRLSVDDATFAGVDSAPLRVVQGPEDLAYVIFTSGSTGQPKGVMIDHRGAVNTVLDINERFGVGPDDRVLSLSSLSFDLSVYDIFGVLAAGGAIVLPSATATRDPSHWADLLVEERVTLWNSVPALMQLLVEHVADRPGAPRLPLRTVMMSGDWIPVALPDRIRPLCGDVQVISLGGATEASIWSIIYPIDEVNPAWQSIPYGRPMKNQTFHVLNEKLEPCPTWVVGELYIGGIGLARGYWRDPQKTAARFITHPVTGERLYRTGDLGRYMPGADIEFLGREDFQVKVQGYRIELGEIEAALEQHPMVRAAVVSTLGDAPFDKRLVAYVVPRVAAEPVPAAALRSFLQEKLPEYMVPPSFLQLDALPLSSNGKVDRKALPVPGQSSAGQERVYVAPRTITEQRLAEAWESLLGVSPIGVKDSFFELGGHSFAAVRLMAQIQKMFGESLPLSTLLAEPTIERLAVALEEGGAGAAWSSLVSIQPDGDQRPFFCVHPVGGNVLCYAELARRLGSDRPFYGLQAQGLDGSRAPFEDLTQMAAHYLEAIRSVQPEGPYLLGGWSMGGIVAFEMARQLRAQGQEVALLALLDSEVPVPSDELDDARLLAWFLRDLGGGVAVELPEGARQGLGSQERLDATFAHARAIGVIPSDVDLPQFERLFAVFKANQRAMASYAPRSYQGRIVLFRASEGAGGSTRAGDPAAGWDALGSQPVEVHAIPGDHYTMLSQRGIVSLADQLRACLDRAN